MMHRTAVAIRHIAFEDLGSFEAVLHDAGYRLRYHDIGRDNPERISEIETDLLIVLGGPIGAYDEKIYPFLADELSLLRARLSQQRPTLGICLGAQLIAAALGAAVRPTGMKEIGFAPLSLTEEGLAGPLCRLERVFVLHWHGDTFDIPPGGVRLAQTASCRNQAFSIGRHTLGVQFHPEADVTIGFERWLVGHASELAAAAIDPGILRCDASIHGDALREAGRAMFRDWLKRSGA